MSETTCRECVQRYRMWDELPKANDGAHIEFCPRHAELLNLLEWFVQLHNEAVMADDIAEKRAEVLLDQYKAAMEDK